MSRLRNERGQVIVLTVIALTVLLGMSALVLDVGAWFRTKRQLQATADAAALAGAQALPDAPGTAQGMAVTYADKNGGGVLAGDVTITSTYNGNDTIAVAAKKNQPGFFSRVFGVNAVDVGAKAKALVGVTNQAMYDVPERAFRETLDELIALLGLEPLLTKQVRKLSLGERMKCEIAAALLHQPRVLFLDEPTIGLDVTAQAAVREFLHAYNRRQEVTILLTSHYMADVVALARRILVIDHGHLIYDGDLQALVERTAPYKLLRLTFSQAVDLSDLARLGEVEEWDGLNVTVRVPRESSARVAAAALTRLPVLDIAIEDPEAEEIIAEVFRGGVQSA